MSSSSVVTPGRTIRRNSSRTCATSRPAARIFSSSFFDFPIIICLPAADRDCIHSFAVFYSLAVHGLFDVRVNRFGVARAVNAAKASRLLVVFEERLRLVLVGREPRLYRFCVVVRAPPELRFGMKVADVINFGRLQIDVVNLAADGTVAPPRHSLLKNVEGHVNENRDEPVITLGSEAFEHLGLAQCARKAVEYVTVAAIGLRGALLDEPDRQVIGDE